MNTALDSIATPVLKEIEALRLESRKLESLRLGLNIESQQSISANQNQTQNPNLRYWGINYIPGFQYHRNRYYHNYQNNPSNANVQTSFNHNYSQQCTQQNATQNICYAQMTFD